MSSDSTTRAELARGFVALVVILGLAIAAVYGVVVALDHLRSGVAAAVVTASATILISVFTFAGSQRADRRRLIEQSVREKKLPLYDEWVHFQFETNLAGDLTEDEVIERWKAFNRESLHTFILWVSEPVLASYNKLRQIVIANAKAGRPGSPDLLFAFEDVLLAIRKDLGHSNNGIRRGDLLRLWINDIDDALLPSPPPTTNSGAHEI